MIEEIQALSCGAERPATDVFGHAELSHDTGLKFLRAHDMLFMVKPTPGGPSDSQLSEFESRARAVTDLIKSKYDYITTHAPEPGSASLELCLEAVWRFKTS